MTLYEIIETAITTKQVRADGTLTPLLAQSRRAPMRSAVKRYGSFLGIDANTAGPESYHRPDHEIRALIETKAPDTLAANTLRNLSNDIVALLRIGVEQEWLAPLPSTLLSWRQRRPDPKRTHVQRREETICTERYAISLDEAPRLKDDLLAYLRWCEAPVARNRPRAIVKRPVSNRFAQENILRLAGFAVRYQHYPADTLTLVELCQPDFLESYINWWIARRGKVTVSLHNLLISPATIARHWLKDEATAEIITHMRDSLPPIEAVHQKDRHWLSLQTIEEVAQSVHPMNPRRVQDYPRLRYSYSRRTAGRRTGWYIEMSLMLRLLIRVPMRQRCIREMQLGKNLYEDHDGVWQIRFVGSELKIDTVGGMINRYEFPFPTDLIAPLNEWLTDWRPRLATPDETHVFLNANGRPMNASHVGRAVSGLTYRFAGVSVNPHLIRDIWATEYLNATGDVAGCARRLGNTIQMVMQRYAHVIKKDADARAEAFMSGIFANGKGKSRTRRP